jgi:hypothetical protein
MPVSSEPALMEALAAVFGAGSVVRVGDTLAVLA